MSVCLCLHLHLYLCVCGCVFWCRFGWQFGHKGQMWCILPVPLYLCGFVWIFQWLSGHFFTLLEAGADVELKGLLRLEHTVNCEFVCVCACACLFVVCLLFVCLCVCAFVRLFSYRRACFGSWPCSLTSLTDRYCRLRTIYYGECKDDSLPLKSVRVQSVSSRRYFEFWALLRYMMWECISKCPWK